MLELILWREWPIDAELRCAPYESPLGTIWVAFAHDCFLAAKRMDTAPTRLYEMPLTPTDLPRGLRAVWDTGFLGKPPSDWQAVPFGLSALEQTFLSHATAIPFGTTMSYGILAAVSGHRGLSRAVGRAMKKSPITYLIPTHRVILASGRASDGQTDPLTVRMREFEKIYLP